MTAKEFGSNCPECDAPANLCNWYPFEGDGQTYVAQEGSCVRCGATWNEVYHPWGTEITNPAERWANGALKVLDEDGE
jgi:hypothetical protein